MNACEPVLCASAKNDAIRVERHFGDARFHLLISHLQSRATNRRTQINEMQ